jgi:hypothetical protein
MSFVQTSKGFAYLSLIHSSSSLLFVPFSEARSAFSLDLATLILSNAVLYAHPSIHQRVYKQIDTKLGEALLVLTVATLFLLSAIYKTYQIIKYHLFQTNYSLPIKIILLLLRAAFELSFYFIFLLQVCEIYHYKIKEKQKEISALLKQAMRSTLPTIRPEREGSRKVGLFSLPTDLFPEHIFTFFAGEEIAKISRLSRAYYHLVHTSPYFYLAKVRELEIILLKAPYISCQEMHCLTLVKFSLKHDLPEKAHLLIETIEDIDTKMEGLKREIRYFVKKKKSVEANRLITQLKQESSELLFGWKLEEVKRFIQVQTLLLQAKPKQRKRIIALLSTLQHA